MIPLVLPILGANYSTYLCRWLTREGGFRPFSRYQNGIGSRDREIRASEKGNQRL